MIYDEAAKFIESSGAGSLKNRVYRQISDKRRAKAIFALVAETLKFRHVLEKVIDATGISKEEKRLKKSVTLVMAYDLLLSKAGRLVCGKCQEKDAILRHKTRLKAELTRWKLRNGPPTPKSDDIPIRWIRTNYGRYSNTEMESLFRRLGFEETTDLALVVGKRWARDRHVVGLYAIDSQVALSKWPEYLDGRIIIQDRASCFPVAMLIPKSVAEEVDNNVTTVPQGKYVDACAAPGNKTTQLAAWSGGQVLAYERDGGRAGTLRKMIERSGLDQKIEVFVQDFTQSDPCEASGIIVDPSCSGSGTFGRTDSDVSEERLANLAEFQYNIMLHALKYNCAAVVYSTCSVHAEENEQVVRRLLETPAVAEKWRLRQRPLPHWPRRGFVTEFEGIKKDIGDADNLAEACIRVEPRTDYGIGFFAACFERR